MIAISLGNGSGDAQGSQRGLEYDTMSGRYSDFVETEVLPKAEEIAHVKLTTDPDRHRASQPRQVAAGQSSDPTKPQNASRSS